MRPTIDQTMLGIALQLAERGTCTKAHVGCVLTDARGRILATGYNGVASGRPHCNQSERVPMGYKPFGEKGLGLSEPSYFKTAYPHRCAGAKAPSGSDLCEAVHAEQNALTWCARPDDIHTCYLARLSPCMRCTKQLLNTGCKRIVFLEEYDREPQAKLLWEGADRDWVAHRALPVARQRRG